VTAERRPPAWLPWLLCWISLGLMLSGSGLRIAFPEEADGGVFDTVAYIPGYALVPLVGALIAAHLPTNPYGWLWCALGFLYGVVTLSDGLDQAGLVPAWIAWLFDGVGFAVILCLLVLVLLLFPTGRPPGAAWRWPVRAAFVAAGTAIVAVPFAPTFDDHSSPTPWAVGGPVGNVFAGLLLSAIRALFLLILLAAVSVLLRFRRAGPVERQQLKWFLFAAGLASVSLVVNQVGVPVSARVWAVVDAAGFALLPTAVAIAVLRYRLYEIDRIVSRTVSYGLLSAGLIGLYLVVVALLRPLLEPLTGSSALAVAGSTLAVAAVFNPARRRLQAAVDRRFDRARYDAARAVDAFAARLRDQVNLDEITAGLRDTVAATVAPGRVGVWLRGPTGLRGPER
jgi:hypothetical protein